MSSFLHPGMLWGLLLAGVPIVIHLLARRRYQTVRWAAQEFLRAAFRKNQRRLRIENLLLLLVRTAIVLLLALALARPFLSGGVARALSDQPVHTTILLDNSYSMGLNEGVSSPFDRAVREAQRIVAGMDREDSVTLYLTNDDFSGAKPGTPRAVIRDSHDTEKVKAVLGRISAGKASFGSSRLADAFAEVAARLDPAHAVKHVVVLTDLQRAAWEAELPEETGPGAGEDGSTRTIRDLLEEIVRKGASIHVVDVGAPAPQNVAVADLRPARRRPLIERNEERFLATVLNYGSRRQTVDLVWKVDGRHKGATPVELPPAGERGRPGEAVAEFRLPELQAGPRGLSVELPTDALPADDRRFFAARVRERIRVLAVDGDPKAEDGMSPETAYLKVAIAPKPDRIEMVQVDYLSFLTTELAGYDLVILANLERVREDKVEELQDFVREGGGLVVFLGNRVDPVLANRDLYRDGEGLLPAELLREPVQGERETGDVRFDLEDLPSHPLLGGIFGAAEDPDGFLRALAPRVWGWYPVVEPGDDAGVLIRLTDAQRRPALLEKRYGAGRVMMFTTAADLDWSDLPRVMIVPLMHEITYYATQREGVRSNLVAFEPFRRELPDRVIDVEVTTPDGGKVKVAPVVEEDRRARVDFRETAEPGVYRADYRLRGDSAIDARTQEAAEVFSVNVDAREGDLRRIEAREIEERYPGMNLRIGPSFVERTEQEAEAPRGEIWKPLVALVLLLLMLEVLLARRFGDHSRRARTAEGGAS